MNNLFRPTQAPRAGTLKAGIPLHLRDRPVEPAALAHYLLWAEAGDHPDAHLPCQPGLRPRGCDTCWEKSEMVRQEGAGLPYEQMVHPNEEREARGLIAYWYTLGAITGVPVIIHGAPVFDPTRVPRPHR